MDLIDQLTVYHLVARQQFNIMVKVLFLVTSHGKMGNLDRKTGWYLPEVAHPYQVFQAAGYEQVIVSPKGGKAPMVRG